MFLEDKFRLGNKKLSKNFSHKISKIGLKTTFLRKQGLVRLNREQVDDFVCGNKIEDKMRRSHGPDICCFHCLPENILIQRLMAN